MPSTATDLVRGVALASVVGLLVVLGVYLRAPGGGTSRLVLFVAIAAAAIAGAVGVVGRRSPLALGGAAGLFLLGVWQFVLGIYVLPVAAVLALVGILDLGDESKNASPARTAN